MVNYLQIRLILVLYCKVAMVGAIDNVNGSLRMRTRDKGGLSHCVRHAYRGRGSENSDFGAYVLNGRPLSRGHTASGRALDKSSEIFNLAHGAQPITYKKTLSSD